MINYIINSYTKEKKSTHEKLDVGKELEGKTYYLGRTFCFVLGKSNNSVDLKKKKCKEGMVRVKQNQEWLRCLEFTL